MAIIFTGQIARRASDPLLPVFRRTLEATAVIGITGTKGKSSVAHLLYQSLCTDRSPLLIGTTGIHFKGRVTDTPNTTPESYVLQRHMADALRQGATHVVMEMSSQALDMDRAWAIDLDLAIFTNLSRDHIGPKEHPSFEAYRDAKAKIFTFAKTSLINKDAAGADTMLQVAREPYCFTTEADNADPRTYVAEDIRIANNDLSFTFRDERVTLHPAAHFLLENALAALAALDLLLRRATPPLMNIHPGPPRNRAERQRRDHRHRLRAQRHESDNLLGPERFEAEGSSPSSVRSATRAGAPPRLRRSRRALGRQGLRHLGQSRVRGPRQNRVDIASHFSGF